MTDAGLEAVAASAASLAVAKRRLRVAAYVGAEAAIVAALA